MAGFTIVELVIVVILLAILGVTAISRSVEPSAFAPSIVTHRAIEAVRYAHQIAASRQDAVVTLTVTQDGADWRFRTSTDVDGVVDDSTVGRENSTLDATSGAVTASLDAATPLVLRFDGRGAVDAITIGASSGDVTRGVQIAVGGDSARTICVYPTGYAANDACL